MKFFFPPLLYDVQREGDLSLELLPFKNHCLFVCFLFCCVFVFVFVFDFFCQGKIFNYMFRINGACIHLYYEKVRDIFFHNLLHIIKQLKAIYVMSIEQGKLILFCLLILTYL